MDCAQADAKELLKVKNWKSRALERPDLGCSTIGERDIYISSNKATRYKVDD
jgi:hypothetical protein